MRPSLLRIGVPALLLVIIAGALLLPAGAALMRRDKLLVVTTVAPHADLVREIAGDRVDVLQLVPDGTDSHTFEPRPSDARYLQEADLIVLNGLHLETPTQQLADANKRPETPYLLLGDNTITPDEWVFDFSFPAAEGDPNPHLWLNALFARKYAELIATHLEQIDPQNAAYYQPRFATLAARMDTLDQAIYAAVQSVPENNRKLLTYHDSWAYFAQRYGMEVIGAIQPSDFSEPSPREVGALIDQVRLYNLPAIFGSEVYASRVLEVIGRETGAQYVSSLRDDDLPGAPGSASHTYLGMMVEDMRTMISALGGRTDVFDGIDPSPIAS
jgi:ABC-type Zn uptake system ZnuABC Zn-binding protein ZnuA